MENQIPLYHSVRLNPDSVEFHNNLGSKGRVDEAIGHFREAFRLKADNVNACNNIARVLQIKAASSNR